MAVTRIAFEEDTVRTDPNRITIQRPAGTQNGDLLVCFPAIRNAFASIVFHSSWTDLTGRVESNTISGYLLVQIVDDDTPGEFLFTTTAGNAAFTAFIGTYRGVDQDDPIVESILDDQTRVSTELPIDSVDSVPDGMFVGIVGSSLSLLPITAPPGMDLLYAQAAGQSPLSTAVADADTDGTPTGVRIFSCASSSGQNSLGGAISLRPGGGPAATPLKIWDGAEFVSGTPKIWDGAEWVPGVPRIWDGSQWVPS